MEPVTDKPKRLVLSKPQRAELAMMFDGRCAYCGGPLGDRWHADHIEPVIRNMRWVRGKGYVSTGAVLHACRDTIENLFPACAPCNIDKHSLTLEYWREVIQRRCEVLSRDSATYRSAKRFGLITETSAVVEFYFEKIAAIAQEEAKHTEKAG